MAYVSDLHYIDADFGYDCDYDCDYDHDLDYASDSDPFSFNSPVTFAGPLSDDHHPRYESDSGSSVARSDSNCFNSEFFESHPLSEQYENEPEFGLDLDPFPSDLGFRVFEGSGEIGEVDVENDVLGLGFGDEFDGFGEVSNNREENSRVSGLRVVRIESDSDSDLEEEEIVGVDLGSGDFGEIGENELDIPLCWDRLQLEDQRNVNEDFEWEQVDERVDQFSESSESSIEEEAIEGGEHVTVRNLEWEVLLSVNNLERNPDIENEGDADGNSYLADQDDYVFDAEYATLFGQFVENESASKGSPPAAKTVIENLPVVALEKEGLEKSNVACAICKDEILLEEKVRKLPCCHYYHGDCILPWLSIRNTCPVCRYELPTDDPDYERRKSQRSDHGGMPQDLQLRYDFGLSP